MELNNQLIGISGKIGSGKDTVAAIWNYNIYNDHHEKMGKVPLIKLNDFIDGIEGFNNSYKIKKFADKLKDIVCLLIGCTRQQLEDREFKEAPLGEDWVQYRVANGVWIHSDNNPSHKMMDSKECDVETYEAHKRTNWQTAYKTEYSPRILLQYIGTELFRNQLLNNTWVNATMADYKPIKRYQKIESSNYHGETIFEKGAELKSEFPNWIISDMRFPNELEAIKKRNGVTIRVERWIDEEFTKEEAKDKILSKDIYAIDENNVEFLITSSDVFNDSYNYRYVTEKENSTHESETALDDAKFDFTIDNNGSIEDLIEKVLEIQRTLNIIK